MISKENMELTCILQIINQLPEKLFEKLVLISPSFLKNYWLTASISDLFDNLSWVMHESLLYDQHFFYADHEINLFFYIQLIFCPSWCLWQCEAFSPKIMLVRMRGKWDCSNLNIWLLKTPLSCYWNQIWRNILHFLGGCIMFQWDRQKYKL